MVGSPRKFYGIEQSLIRLEEEIVKKVRKLSKISQKRRAENMNS